MSDEQWRDKLTEEEYKVTRMCGTEPPFSGKYYKHDEIGSYYSHIFAMQSLND